MKGGEGQACRVQHANMWQHCSLAAVQGMTTPVADSILVSHQTDVFSFATHGDECVYSANIIYIQSYLCFSVVAQATDKICPRPAQGLFRSKSVWTTAKLIVPMKEGWWKLRMLMYDAFNVPTCWQHFSLSAVQRKTAFVQQSLWPEFDMFGSMPWCSFPWHKLLPRLAQKNCYTFYHPNLIHECTSFFSTKVIFEGLPKKAFPRK